MSAVALSTLTTCISTMVTAGELKSSYLNSPNMSQALVTDPNPATGNASDIVVCFQPQSNSQQLDPNTKYTQSGGAGTSCKSQGGTNACYWCAQ